MSDMRIVLASESPRRRELFSLISKDFNSISSEVDESVAGNLKGAECCAFLACAKCEASATNYPDCAVIGCDTVVVIGNETLGKPKDEADAKRMLKALSGRTHEVFTAVHIICPNGVSHFVERSAVHFCEMSDCEIDDYVQSKEPFGKAGAYAIQGIASRFISGIDGDYFNIVGLPVSRLYHELKKLLIV